MKARDIFIKTLATGASFVPIVVLAQAPSGSGLNVNICQGNDCKIDHFFLLINGVVDFFIRWVFTPAVTLLIGWVGIKLVISREKPGAISDAKLMLWKVFWGAVFVLGGFLVVKLIVTSLQTDTSIVDRAIQQ